MINLPSKIQGHRPALARGLVAAVALAGCTALAMPAQAAVQLTPVMGAVAITTSSVAATTATPPAAVAQTTAGYTTATSWNAVRYNKLYSTPNLAASKCKEPKLALDTAVRIKAYDKAMLDCLGKVWAPIITKAGGSYTRPALVVHGYSSVNTHCGRVTGPTSFYCSYGSGQIYIPYKQIVAYWKQNPAFARAYATNTFAHEYGHHVQARTGIMAASWWRQQYYMKTTSGKLQESRRRELQASCLGSVYIGANRAYYPMSGAILTQWKYLIAHSGDMKGYPRDHGSFANHNFWSLAGYNGRHAASCQTYAAAASRVS